MDLDTHLVVHICWCIFHRFGQIYSDIYPSLHITQIVSHPKNSLSSACSSLSTPVPGNHWCFIVFIQSVSSVAQSCPTLWPHESQHARPPCLSPTPRVYSNLCPSSQWYHPTISSSVAPFSSCPQSLPASGSFPISQLFEWGGQSTGVSASASVLPMNTQDWSPLGWTGWISLQSKGLSRVFSNTSFLFFRML